MHSPFVTVRYPDGAWELTDSENVPKVGETLRRSDGKWVVTTADVDDSGHVIVTWQRPETRLTRRTASSPPDVRNTLAVRPTLFEFAGGEEAFLALARAHHARCLADPELNHPFSHDDQHPQHVERLAAYWAEVLGGPPAYSQTCGDESSVLRMHAGNGDMGDLGDRFVDCFVQALDDADLPDDPAFREALHAYMRWAVDNVLSYSAEDAVVAAGIRMPRWDWDGLQD